MAAADVNPALTGTDMKSMTRPGVNFNILRAAFMHADPKNAKNAGKLSVFFVLLVSLCVKAACRTLMKFTPVFDFTDTLQAAFTLADPKS